MNSNEPKNPTEHRSFKQKLKLFGSTMIVIASMIGCGIFIVSADIARTFTWPGLIIVLLGIPVYFLWTYYSQR
jgi:amino acid transporter